MHFTHQKHLNPNIEFRNQTISPKAKLRWLGFWMDPKLSFNSHLRKIKDIGQKIVAQLRRPNKAYSVLGLREAKHLITTVLRSRVLYGSVVWFTTANLSKVSNIFQVINAEANGMILGAFKKSPTDLMVHNTNLTPFAIAAVRLHHVFFHKRMTAPDFHPRKILSRFELTNKRSTHKSPISNMVRLEDFESLQADECEINHPLPSPPWDNMTADEFRPRYTGSEKKSPNPSS